MNLSDMMNRSEGGERRDVQLLRSSHQVPNEHANGFRRQAAFSPTLTNNAGQLHHFQASDAASYTTPQEQRDGPNMHLAQSTAPSLSPHRYSVYDESQRRPPLGSHEVSSDPLSSGSMDIPRNAWPAQPSQYVFVKENDLSGTADGPPKNDSQSPHKMNGSYMASSTFASTSKSPYNVDQSVGNTFKNLFENGLLNVGAATPEIRTAMPLGQTGSKAAAVATPKKILDTDPDAKLAKLSSRTVTGENVNEENIVDGYVQFVFAHDPMYASDDVDSIIYLKKKIMATPKTQDLTYSAWDIYALVTRLHIQELKNWSQLVGELGHTDISTRPQFAQRIKRWMQKYKIDRYFDYLLGNQYSYDAPSSKFSGCLAMGTNHRRKAASKSDADEVDLLTPDGDADSTSSPKKRRKLKERHEKHEYDEADIPAVDEGEDATGEESSIKIGGSSDVEEDESRVVVVAGSRKRARGALPTNLISNRPKSSPGFVADDEEQSGDYSEVERDSDDNAADSDDNEEEEEEEEEEEDEEDEGEEAEEEEEEEVLVGEDTKTRKLGIKQHGDLEDQDEEDELNSSASSAGSPRWTPSAPDMESMETLPSSQDQSLARQSSVGAIHSSSSGGPLAHNRKHGSLSTLPISPKPVSPEETTDQHQLPSPKLSTEGLDNTTTNHNGLSQVSSSPSSMVFEDGEHDKPSGSIKDRLMRMFIPSSEDTAMTTDAPETTVDSICCVNCGHSQPQTAQLQKEVHSLRRMLNSLHEQMDRQALEHRQSFEQMARRVKQKDTEIERIQAWRRQVIDTFLNGPPQ